MSVKEKSAYAKAGVDYSLMEPFKMAMIEAGKKDRSRSRTSATCTSART